MTTEIPTWCTKVQELYQDSVSNVFILEGNVRDYVVPGIRLRNFISQWMSKKTIVFYDRSSGITFANAASERTFRQVTKLEGGQSPANSNPAIAALMASRGQPQAADTNGPELPSSPEAALPLLEQFMLSAEDHSAAIVIDFAETICPAADIAMMSANDRTGLVTLARWGGDQALEKKAQLVFLVTAELGSVNDALKASTSRIEIINLPWPDLGAREAFIAWHLQDVGGKVETEMDAHGLATMTAGLTLLGVEDIFLRAERVGKLSFQDVRERKSSLIKAEYGDVLEVMDPKGGFETVGGLDWVKRYFQKRIINPIQKGRLGSVPMGVLMMGPAGTGKSIMATAVARECGFNAVKLNLGGQIASKWQGEGERKLAKALQGISTFSPTIVFIDEIDQAAKRDTGGSNQQEARIFQMLLEFMSDTTHRGQVVFLAATNRPDNLDAALLRPGRLDDKIAFLVPGTNDERKSIFEVMAKKFGLKLDRIPKEVLEHTAGYTGAEIEKITMKAVTILEDGDAKSPANALLLASQKIRQSTRAIVQMTAIALSMLDDEDYVPPEYREYVGATPAEIENLIAPPYRTIKL